MKFNKLTFGDIMQRNIIYYDNDVQKACFGICETLRIDNMPAIDGKSFFELDAGRFQMKQIISQNKLDIDQRIFQDQLIEKFDYNKHNVLFVFEGKVLKGIVHLSDYNDNIVIQTIQDDILKFERNLRQWYVLNDLGNDKMIDFYHYKLNQSKNKKNVAYWEARIKMAQFRKDEMNVLGEFQLFDFKDLLLFGCSSNTKKVFPIPNATITQQKRDGVAVLAELRNLAMHGKNPIELDQQNSIYQLSSLQTLFEKLEFLKAQYLRLLKLNRNHKDYIKSIQIDNQNKLKIIHDHHPKALEYFISKD